MYYKEFYRDERINKYAKQAGVKLVYMGDDTKTTLADR
jgi:hypothetical protein